MIKLERISKDHISDIWPQIEHWVKDSIGKDLTITPEDVKKKCMTGETELRLVYADKLKGFFTSVIYPTPQGIACYVPHLGGEDLMQWLAPFYSEFKEYLKEIGCIQLSFIGRKVWQRIINADYEGYFYLINL